MNQKKKIILFFAIFFPLMIASVFASWVIVNTTQYTPSYNPNSTSALFEAYNNQTKEYNGTYQFPTSTNEDIDDDNISFSYREANTTGKYKAGLPHDAGTYDILLQDETNKYADDVVRFTISQASVSCDVIPIIQDMYEGDPIVITNEDKLVFKGVKNETIIGNIAISSDVAYPEGSTKTSETIDVSFTFTPNSEYSKNYTTSTITSSVKLNAVAYIVGKSTYYGAIHKAMNVAERGDIVTVIPPKLNNYHDENNKVEPDKVEYKIFNDCTIKEGVSFVIPTDINTFSTVTNTSTLTNYINSLKSGDSSRGSIKTYNTSATSNEKLYKRVNIQINENIKLINNGTLVLSGYLSGGSSGSGMICHTSHSYSTITLSKNSKIIQNNSSAITYCFGFIKETYENNNSIFNVDNGKFYIPYVVNDYRGFTNSWAMTDGAINNERCSPFNQFSFPNIECQTFIKYESKIIGVVTLRVIYDSQDIDRVFNEEVTMIGNDTNYFIQLTDENYSYVEYKYSKTTTIAKVKLYGGNKLNNFSLSLKVSPVTIDLSTTNSYFPVSYRLNIELCKSEGQSRASYNLSTQRFKLLPGSSFTINDGCDVTGTEISVYTAFYDGSTGNNEYTRYGAGIAYPLKKGAIMILKNNCKLDVSKIAGTIYSDNATLNFTSDTIKTKEPWNVGSSGGIYPPWNIAEYLEINEKLSICSLNDYSKEKLYAGINIFTKYNEFVPKYNLEINNSSIEVSIDTYQKVIHLDEINNYKFEFVADIYKAYNYTTPYKKDSIISYSENNSILCAINSSLKISNNNNGINEFNVQDISISCSTQLINDQIPLYVDTAIQLEAKINDINKAYEKTITWSSDNSNVASVDKNGKVTGKTIGKTTIRVLCDGVYGTFEVEVLEKVEITKIESIVIVDSKNNKRSDKVEGQSNYGGSTKTDYHGKYSNNTNIVFTLEINPADAPIGSITWTFSGSGADRHYLNDPEKSSESVSGVYSVTVHILDGTGASDDRATLKCTVVGLDPSNIIETTFVICHKADCITSGTLLTLSDGSTKKVEDLLDTDMLLVFNHETGQLEAAPITFVDRDGWANYNVVNLEFSNGEKTRLIYEHGYFNNTLNKYVYITENNYLDYIGHEFAFYNGNSFEKVTLVNSYITNEYIGCYSLVTAYHLNYFVDGMLSMPGGIEGLFNIFEYNDDMTYDIEKMNEDIEKYGLYTYEDFKDYLPYEVYLAFPGPYLKVSVGKGYVTFEEILAYIEQYLGRHGLDK